MKKISIIVPCFNEEKNIEQLVKRFLTIRRKYNIELVLVDNGSNDRTKEEISRFAVRYHFIKLVSVDINEGYGYGILRGLQEASGDYLGWIHADLQSNPFIFCKMIDKAILEKVPFLYKGLRKKRPIFDTLFTIGMSLYESIILHNFFWDINAQPTLLSRDFYNSWNNAPYDFSLDLYVYYLAKVSGIKIQRFKSVHYHRLHGTSTWNTGMIARMKLIKRVISYSRNLKKTMDT